MKNFFKHLIMINKDQRRKEGNVKEKKTEKVANKQGIYVATSFSITEMKLFLHPDVFGHIHSYILFDYFQFKLAKRRREVLEFFFEEQAAKDFCLIERRARLNKIKEQIKMIKPAQITDRWTHQHI